jgi:hypothetical protein
MKKGVRKFCFTFISLLTCVSLCFTTFAQELRLPAPTQMVSLSAAQSHPVLRGVKINPDNPLQIEFIVDKQQEKTVTKEDIKRLVSYFMAALTIPEEELWVNLSPYEQDRIIPNELGQTAFGEGLLAQDYFLKQLTSSLTYPESTTGKNYWQMALSGQQKVVSTFNKIWIVPQAAEIYENGNTALITKAKLKVMSEEDYLATQKNQDVINRVSASDNSTKALKRVIIPQIEKEVNSGDNFSELRQIFCSYILAKWFKNKLKDSLYKYYIDQKKINGIDLTDKTIKEKIYNQYVEAFKKGVYNYIKKDYNPSAHKTTRRQYFSGGIVVGTQVTISHDSAAAAAEITAGGPFSGKRAGVSDGPLAFVRRMPSDARGVNILPLALTLTLGGALVGVTTQVGCDTGLKVPFPGDGGTGDAPGLVSEAGGGNKGDGGTSSSDDAAAPTPKPDVAASAGTPDVAVAGSASDASSAGGTPDVTSDSAGASSVDAATTGSADAPNPSPDAAFHLPPTLVLAGNDYLKDVSALVAYANKNFKSGVGYPNEGLIKLANALMNANQAAAYGTGIADQIRTILTQDPQAALVITGQFDPLYLAALAIELNKQPSDLLNSLYSLINQLTAWKADPVASAGYVADPDKEKVLYVLAMQYGLAMSDLFKKFPKLTSDADYPFILRIALQILGYKPGAGDSLLSDLTADYQKARAQLGVNAGRADLEALVLSWHGKGNGTDLVAMRSAFVTFAQDQNTVFSYGLSDSVIASFGLSTDLAVASAGSRYVATDAGAATDLRSIDMTDIDTAEERAKIAHSQPVLDAKAGWRKALRKKELPVNRAEVTLRLPGHDPEKISVSVAYVEDMPKGLRGTVVDGVVILPSEGALMERSGRMLKKAGLTVREVLDDRLKHEAFEPRLGSHTVTWLVQEYEYGGDLTPEQKLQMAEHEGDAVWKTRMQLEALTGRGSHEAAIKKALGDTAEVGRLIAANKKHYGGVNLKAEIKTQGNSKAITFKLSPRIVEQFKKNGLRFDIVKFGYGVNLQELFNGR